jgi:hypothetical protein
MGALTMSGEEVHGNKSWRLDMMNVDEPHWNEVF